jgi:hypothetical protein
MRRLSLIIVLFLFISLTGAYVTTNASAQAENTIARDIALHLLGVASDALPFITILPQSCFLWPLCLLCLPLTCCFAPLYLLIPLINLGGYALMPVIGFFSEITGCSMSGVALIPTIFSLFSAILSSLLTYPAMQASCVSLLTCLPCVLLASPIGACQFVLSLPCIIPLLILPPLVPLYYRDIFPRITEKRQRLSEEHGWLGNPLFSLISYNCEHAPSYLESPALWWQFLLCIHPEQFIALPVCCLTSTFCWPVTFLSLFFNLCLQLPSILNTIHKLQHNFPILVNPQNSCLPTYPGILS